MSEPTGPSDEERFKAMLTLAVWSFLSTGNRGATLAREVATDAATVDDAAIHLEAWFIDGASGEATAERLDDVWRLMAYQAMPLVDWFGLAHKIRNPDFRWLSTGSEGRCSASSLPGIAGDRPARRREP